MLAALTEKRVRDAKPESKTYVLWDVRVKGLGLRVTPGSVKAYILDYRVDGTRRRATLGRPGLKFSLADARSKASEIKTDGSDPLRKREERREAPSLADALNRFFDDHCERRIKAGRMQGTTAKEYRRQARLYLKGLSHLKVADIDRQDIVKALATASPGQYNRVLAFVSSLFNRIESWEWRPQHSNPARGIERNVETPRDRVFNMHELARLANALDSIQNEHPAPVAAIRVAALTGLRIGEVIGLRWEDVDLATGLITLIHTKTGRRQHHLGSAALDVIKGRPRIHGEPFIFCSGRGKPTYAHVRKVFAKVAEAAGLKDARLHDLRRTVLTNLASTGANAFLIRDVAGHKTLAMSNRYVRMGGAVADARRMIDNQMAAAMGVSSDA